jgi:predicted Fe-S protein YdhL (DUF1289 family)
MAAIVVAANPVRACFPLLRRAIDKSSRSIVRIDSSRAPMAVPPSPCTKVCTLDPACGLCRGCGRTLIEIERWLGFSDAERARIMALLPERMAQARLACPG